jgi:hypothetical protein
VIEALIRGESYPAKLAHPRLKASPQELCEALRGPTCNRYAVDAAIARIIEAFARRRFAELSHTGLRRQHGEDRSDGRSSPAHCAGAKKPPGIADILLGGGLMIWPSPSVQRSPDSVPVGTTGAATTGWGVLLAGGLMVSPSSSVQRSPSNVPAEATAAG